MNRPWYEPTVQVASPTAIREHRGNVARAAANSHSTPGGPPTGIAPDIGASEPTTKGLGVQLVVCAAFDKRLTASVRVVSSEVVKHRRKVLGVVSATAKAAPGT